MEIEERQKRLNVAKENQQIVLDQREHQKQIHKHPESLQAQSKEFVIGTNPNLKLIKETQQREYKKQLDDFTEQCSSMANARMQREKEEDRKILNRN